MLTSARTLATESTRLKAEMQKVPRDGARRLNRSDRRRSADGPASPTLRLRGVVAPAFGTPPRSPVLNDSPSGARRLI
jgi:hypothetical protein